MFFDRRHFFPGSERHSVCPSLPEGWRVRARTPRSRCGCRSGNSAAPVEIDLATPATSEQPWPLAQAMRDDAMQLVATCKIDWATFHPGRGAALRDRLRCCPFDRILPTSPRDSWCSESVRACASTTPTAGSANVDEPGSYCHSERQKTGARRAEEALIDKERFIHQIADLTPAAISVFDLATGHETYISRGVKTLLGYTPDEIARMKDPLSTLCHPDDVLRCRDDLTQLRKLAAGGILEMEYRMRRGDGQWRWLASRITAFSATLTGRNDGSSRPRWM